MSLKNQHFINAQNTFSFGKGVGYHNIYFIGIGGIGMSALARYFFSIKKNVGGYDKTKTNLTDSLTEKGIAIHFNDNLDYIPNEFLNKETTLIVYTPAIPNNHSELQYFKNNEYVVMKRSEVLGLITQNSTCLAVAGTHGKTTTSTILGHIMEVCNTNATSFLGGISENYNSNLILGGDRVSVVEADEYDRSFLKLSPNIACITSMDADHLDIYGEKESLEKSFIDFSEKVKDALIIKYGLPLQGITFGFNEKADYQITEVVIKNGTYFFSVKTAQETVRNIQFDLPGRHNLLNAVAAMAMAHSFGLSLKNIKKALVSFKGVQRRFSYKIKEENLILIDDYAHHPTEINAVLNAVNEMYPRKECLVVFQPHLFSRTKDFMDEFASSLSGFDSLILLDIYPARELPIKGISSKVLLEKVTLKNKMISSKEALVGNINKVIKEVVVILGAGDIGAEVEGIKKALLTQRKNNIES